MGGFLPFTLFITPDGKILYSKQGIIDPMALKKLIANSLGRVYWMHNNPIYEKGNGSPTFIDYVHNCAAFYEFNSKHFKVHLVHYGEMENCISSL